MQNTAERFCYCKTTMMVANQKCIFLNTIQLAFSIQACFRIKKKKMLHKILEFIFWPVWVGSGIPSPW